MFYKLINSIKIGFLYKKKLVRLNLNQTEIKLVKKLININIIKWVKKTDSQYYLYLNYTNNQPLFKNIINLYKPSQPLYIDLDNLKKTLNIKNSILLLTTNKGFMTNYEAVTAQTGGIILIKL